MQLYNWNPDADDERVGWQLYDANVFKEYFADSTSGVWGSPVYKSVSSMIPEPSSGLLMLFGLAALALRRRRVKVIVSVAIAAAVLAPTSAFSAADDLRCTFMTTNNVPGYYDDGSEVLVGEYFALVWSDDNVDKPTFYADGTVSEGSKIIGTLSTKRNKKGQHYCYGQFVISKDKYATELSKGSWAVYLLDTRSWNDPSGQPSVAKKSSGDLMPNINSAVGCATLVTIPTSLTVGNATTVTLEDVNSGYVKTSNSTALPKDAPENPVITGIRVDGETVYVTMTNTASYIQYALNSGDNPSLVKNETGTPRSGVTDLNKEVTFAVPRSESGAFFKVRRRGERLVE